MTSPQWELQKAVVAKLEGDATLVALLVGGSQTILDNVPENQAMPYIEYGEHRSLEWDKTPTELSAGYGKEHTISLHVWSGYEGKKQCAAIQARIDELLRDTSLALTGHTLATIRPLSADAFTDPDGQARHGISLFRATTEEI